MKKLALSLLVLLMLTPGMVCAMPVIQQQAKMDAASAAMPCHEEQGHNTKKASNELMLLKDCTKSEFKAADSSFSIKKSDHLVKVFFDAVHHEHASGFQLATAKTIRGPPPDWPSRAQPPILLTTLRIRQ